MRQRNFLNLFRPERCKHSRASIFYSVQSSGIQDKSDIIDKKDNKVHIRFLPNYQIKDQMINFSRKKPKVYEFNDYSQPPIRWKIGQNTQYDARISEDEKNILMTFSAIGQLIFIFISKDFPNDFHLCWASFSIVRFSDSKVLGISALHPLQTAPTDSHHCLIFANMTEVDSKNLFSSVELSDDNTLEESIEYFKKYCTSLKFYELSVCENFLSQRRNYLLDLTKYQKEEKLLDPLYRLQPMPSVDILLLELSQDLHELVANEQIKPLVINSEPISQYAYLVAFHDNTSLIESTIFEYLESPLPKNIPICENTLLNANKSIGICEIAKFSDEIINYYGTTGLGGSGGPLLNQLGEIIGVSFGNYVDHETKGKARVDELGFEIICQKEEAASYTKFKNSNLALNIQHEFIQGFLQKILFTPKLISGEITNKKQEEEDTMKFISRKRRANNPLFLSPPKDEM